VDRYREVAKRKQLNCIEGNPKHEENGQRRGIRRINSMQDVRFYVLRAVTMMSATLWDVTPCSVVEVY
jgi:hypothetical protein